MRDGPRRASFARVGRDPEIRSRFFCWLSPQGFVYSAEGLNPRRARRV
jgi:hypothetical protein